DSYEKLYLVAAKVSNLVRELRLLSIAICMIQRTNFYETKFVSVPKPLLKSKRVYESKDYFLKIWSFGHEVVG
ncbi:MAG: hypothetical protein AAF599_18655, partial [Bacteroidota bacterium]